MDTATAQPSSEKTRAPAPANPYDVVEHTKRPDWGVAVMAWERNDKRGYQFEDGNVRVFKRGFYHLLRPAELPAHRDDAIARRLRKQAALARARRQVIHEAKRTGRDVLTLEQQVEQFYEQYPRGFDDPVWLSEVRGAGAARRLKVHRDPAVADAERLLNGPALSRLLAEGQLEEIHNRAVEVFSGTDLVRPRRLRAIRALSESARDAFAEALVGLLHGEDRLEERFAAYIRAIGPKHANWQLVTAPLALLRPADDICVRPTAFRTQARWMAPNLTYDPQPDGGRYRSWLEMALRVRERLLGAGLVPQDLLDVYDFIRLTAKTK